MTTFEQTFELRWPGVQLSRPRRRGWRYVR